MTLLPSNVEEYTHNENENTFKYNFRNAKIVYNEENGIVLDKWLYEVCGEQGMLFPSHRRAQYHSYLHKMRSTETSKQFTLHKSTASDNTTTDSENHKNITDYVFAYPSRSGTREVLTLQNTLTELNKEEEHLALLYEQLKDEVAKIKAEHDQLCKKININFADDIDDKSNKNSSSGGDNKTNKTVFETDNNTANSNSNKLRENKIITFTDDSNEMLQYEKEKEKEKEEELLELESEQQQQQQQQMQHQQGEEKEQERLEEKHEEEQKLQEKHKQHEKEWEEQQKQEQYKKELTLQKQLEREGMELQITEIEQKINSLREKRGSLLLDHQQLLEQEMQVNHELGALKDIHRILQDKADALKRAQDEFEAMKKEEQQQRQQQQHQEQQQFCEHTRKDVESANEESHIDKSQHDSDSERQTKTSDTTTNNNNNTLESLQAQIAHVHNQLSTEIDKLNETKRTLLREEQIHSGRFKMSRQRLEDWQEMRSSIEKTCDQLRGQVHVLQEIVHATNDRLRNLTESSYADRLVRMNELFILRSGEKWHSWWYGTHEENKNDAKKNMTHTKWLHEQQEEEEEEEEYYEEQSQAMPHHTSTRHANTNNTSSNMTLSNDVNRALTFEDHSIVHSLHQPPRETSASISLTSTPLRNIEQSQENSVASVHTTTIDNNNNSNNNIININTTINNNYSNEVSVSSPPPCVSLNEQHQESSLYSHNDAQIKNKYNETPQQQQINRLGTSASEPRSLMHSAPHHSTRSRSSAGSLSSLPTSPGRHNSHAHSVSSSSSAVLSSPNAKGNKESQKRKERHHQQHHHHRSRYDLISHLQRWCNKLEKERASLITLAGLVTNNNIEQGSATHAPLLSTNTTTTKTTTTTTTTTTNDNNNNDKTSSYPVEKVATTTTIIIDVYGKNVPLPSTNASKNEQLTEMQQNLATLKALLLHEEKPLEKEK